MASGFFVGFPGVHVQLRREVVVLEAAEVEDLLPGLAKGKPNGSNGCGPSLDKRTMRAQEVV